MTFGIHIGHMGGPLDEMRKLWKFADANGFDWFSVSHHFQESPPRGGDLDCYEAISTLTAAAVETRRIRLATSLTTIDHLSGGRVDCGIGAGWHDVEAKAFGLEFPRIFRNHWGPRGDERSGWLRGTTKDAREMIAKFRDAGCARVNIALRDGPYDWDELRAFAEDVVAKS